ncbi:FG-GAP-like repeat-containing protein [Croceitalea vernalis]|uniref:FG-GAP-like repeat-containing protein n=1 Tax=Croceitalea vernalis TaxID=3075599 RepID=A0ABU3BGX7_9FLAO|nr:FG-GAP-like repeat-containing protein [Croceitalea sp. P007]MDT0621385.1 FG-GAP-like repeat-containing protein [Croceitalea sp. P007]
MESKFSSIFTWILIINFFLQSCNQKTNENIMQLMNPNETGIEFINQLNFDKEFNGFNYRNYFNGGGVAIGDINNDGLPDIYFTANLKKNELYLNKGNFTFENITVKSGTGGHSAWSTGVSMVDINGDGLLDIYVSNSGDIRMTNKRNELFINNGDLTFTERALEYNLADAGFGTHASFFDYDKDGDLDAYILNNSYKPLAAFDQRQNERVKRNLLGGDKLMRNDGNIFIDVSEQAGIFGSEIGFGLGVAVGDMNEDGWDDIFVSNDFFERDYLYINQQDGTFSEELTDYFQSISLNSMGADMADVNNDGKNDLFVTDMLPRDDARIKSKTTFMDWNKSEFNKRYGYHNQFSRNVFQLSSPEGYKEVGRFSNLEATDWSWGALIFDLDNDGLKDIFVANGIYQDLTDLDYINYISNEKLMKGLISQHGFDYDKLSKQIPSSPIPNNFFKNMDGLAFKEASNDFGLDLKGFSNGSAYGDLDNDGDLDLVINNVNGVASIYRNNTSGNSISLILKGETNTNGIGSKIFIQSDSNQYYYEQQPIRGFQSSMDTKLVVGLSTTAPINIKILWPEGKVSVLNNIDVNQTIQIKELEAKVPNLKDVVSNSETIFQPISLLDIQHKKSHFVDFDRDRFLYHMVSTKGPKLTLTDWNQDGINDLFVSGYKEVSSQIFSMESKYENIKIDGDFEATEGIFLDVDGDKDLDFIIGSGGVETEKGSNVLKDKLYINENESLIKSIENPFGLSINTSCMATSDFDGDGDLDVFVGEGSRPTQYGLPSDGYLFENKGDGAFEDVTKTWLPSLKGIGMISDAIFADIDGDGRQDLIVTGEFMGIHCFLHSGQAFEPKKNGLDKLKGWWNTLHITDLDADGDLDIVAGNHGLNSVFKASITQPIALFVNDYDKNDFIDPILTKYNKLGEAVPYAIRNDLIDQIASIKKVFPDFKSYEGATVQKMFSKDQLDNSVVAKATQLESMLFINQGDATFAIKTLPAAAQLTPIFAISSGDYDHDGDKDLLLGGNLFGVKPQAGRYDATDGIYLRNEGGLQFQAEDGGFKATGEIRDIVTKDSLVIVGRNDDTVLFFKF